MGRCAIFHCWMPVHVRTLGTLSKMSQFISSPTPHQFFTSTGATQHAGAGRELLVEARWAHQQGFLHDWRLNLMSMTPTSTLTSPWNREDALICFPWFQGGVRLNPWKESSCDVNEPSMWSIPFPSLPHLRLVYMGCLGGRKHHQMRERTNISAECYKESEFNTEELGGKIWNWDKKADAARFLQASIRLATSVWLSHSWNVKRTFFNAFYRIQHQTGQKEVKNLKAFFF